jgi:hypothetical protein
LRDGTRGHIGGIIVQADVRTFGKTREKFTFCVLEDFSGWVEATAGNK